VTVAVGVGVGVGVGIAVVAGMLAALPPATMARPAVLVAHPASGASTVIMPPAATRVRVLLACPCAID
jgi:hypothetical protein